MVCGARVRTDRTTGLGGLLLGPDRVTQGGVSHGNEHARAVIYSFGHQRLVVLYSRLGRLADAERHWKSPAKLSRTLIPNLSPWLRKRVRPCDE